MSVTNPRSAERPSEVSTQIAIARVGFDALEAETARRIATVVAVGWAIFAVLHVLAGRPWVTAVHAGGTLTCALGLLVVRRSPLATLYIVGGASMLCLTLVAAMTGGPVAPSMSFLGLLPLLAGLLEGRLERAAWLSASLVAMASVAFLDPLLPDESTVPSPLESLAGPVGLGILVFLVGTTWRRSSEGQVALLEGRRAKIAAQADRLRLQSEALATARQTAERASAAKSRFVAMTAHELRGPLNGVVGMAEVLKDTRLSQHQADLVTALSTSAESLGKLLQDLLDLSKIEAQRLDVTRAPFEPRELLADVVDTFASAAEERGLELGCIVRPRVPLAVTDDAGRMRQILANLVGNAVKFTQRGSVRLELDVVDGFLVYAVKDTGRGIEAADVERIFAPFEQVSDALLDRRAGTGLGLWISRNFVDAMGGELRVESVRKQGSSFFVRLPLVPAATSLDEHVILPGHPHLVVQVRPGLQEEAVRSLMEHLRADVTTFSELSELPGALQARTTFVILDADQKDLEALRALVAKIAPRTKVALAAALKNLSRAEALSQALKRPVHVLLKPLRASRIASAVMGEVDSGTPMPVSVADVQGTLLVVDDDAINRKVVRFAASQLGYRVLEAESGEKAIEVVLAESPDVVLLDLHMDGMDGVATAEEIARRAAPNGMPSLLGYTGTVNEVDRARCLGAGMEDVLVKPLDRAVFVAALARARRQRTRRRLTGSVGGTEALPILHEETLAKFVQGMGEVAVAQEMCGEFAAELPARAGKIRAAFRDQSRDRLKRESHSLASAAATFGAGRLTLSCRRLESNAESDSFSVLEARVQEIEVRAAEFGPALDRVLARGLGTLVRPKIAR